MYTKIKSGINNLYSLTRRQLLQTEGKNETTFLSLFIFHEAEHQHRQFLFVSKLVILSPLMNNTESFEGGLVLITKQFKVKLKPLTEQKENISFSLKHPQKLFFNDFFLSCSRLLLVFHSWLFFVCFFFCICDKPTIN